MLKEGEECHSAFHFLALLVILSAMVFFILTVTNIHKCKDEARTSLSEKSEKKFSVKVFNPNHGITHPKENCEL